MLEFAKYTEATTLANQLDTIDYYKGVHSVWVCRDTHDYWIVKIHENLNEDYEKEEGTWLVERNKLPHYKRLAPSITTDIKRAIRLDLDDCGGWDSQEHDSLEDCLEAIDGGFGLVKESEYLKTPNTDSEKTAV